MLKNPPIIVLSFMRYSGMAIFPFVLLKTKELKEQGRTRGQHTHSRHCCTWHAVPHVSHLCHPQMAHVAHALGWLRARAICFTRA